MAAPAWGPPSPMDSELDEAPPVDPEWEAEVDADSLKWTCQFSYDDATVQLTVEGQDFKVGPNVFSSKNAHGRDFLDFP